LVDDIKDEAPHTRKMVIQAARTLEVPFFPKVQMGYCGPASLQMIFAYHGRFVTQEEIAEDLHPTIAGVKRDHIEQYARLQGFRVHRERTLGIERVIQAIDNDIPPLLLGHQHAFVACGYTTMNGKINSVLIHDPNYAVGNQEITTRTLDWLWRRHENDREETDALLITR
jgi:ABC-type bacteriocin/lantibiotic exporter with double-glycine peptidase domain